MAGKQRTANSVEEKNTARGAADRRDVTLLPRRTYRAVPIALVVAQTNGDGLVPTLPSDPRGQIAFWIIFAVALGLYFVVSRTRRKAARQYWERHRTEDELRAADPDMRPPD